jgi:hypothetical protein
MPSGVRPQPPAGVCKLVLNGLLFGVHPTVNVWWLKLTSAGAPNAADLLNILTTIKTDFNGNVATDLSSNWAANGFDAHWIPTVGTIVEASVAYPNAGAGGAAVQDASACYVVDWLTGLYYRGGHPRTYFAGVQSADVTLGSTIGGTRLTDLATNAAAWMAQINALSHGDITAVKFGTVSFASGKAWRVPPVFVPYTGVKIRSTIGTQRRRIGGR